MGSVCTLPAAVLGTADLFLLSAAALGVAFALRDVRTEAEAPDAAIPA